jgi:hypothetical protein
MADKNRKEIQVQVLIDAAQAAKTLGELKTALGNIKGAINELGEEGSADVAKLNGALTETTSRLQPLQDAADKAAARVDKLRLTAERFDGISKTLAGSVSLVAGSIGLFGKAGEKTAEVLLKVQSAIAISNGIKDLSEGFVKLATDTGLASIAQTLYTAAVGTSTGALKLFRLALIGTGIGAIVVGIGLLIANFDLVNEYIDKAVDKFGALTYVLFPLLGVIKAVQFALEELGLIESKEDKESAKIADEKFKRYQKNKDEFIKNSDLIQDELQREIDLQKSLGNDVTDLEIKKREARQDTLDAIIKQTELEIKLRKSFGVITDAEYQKQIDYVAGLKKENADLENEIKIIGNERVASNKEANDKIVADNNEYKNDLIKQNDALRKKIEDNNIQLIADETRKNLEILRLNNSRVQSEIQGEIRLLELKTKKTPEEIERIKLLNEFLVSEQAIFFDKQAKLLENYKVFIETAGIEPTKSFKEEIASLNKLPEPTIFGTSGIRTTTDDLNSLSAAFASVASVASASNTVIGDSVVAFSSLFDSFNEKFATFTSDSATGIEKAQAGLAIVGEAINQVSQVLENNTNRNLENLQRETDGRLAAAQAQYNNGVITEEALNAQKQAIALDSYNKETAIKRKAFEQNKKLQIATAIINTAQAALAAYASLAAIPIVGPVLGGVAAAAAAALGVAQIAVISKTKFDAGTPPTFTAPSTPSIPNTNVNSPNPSAANLQLFGTAGSGSTNQQNQGTGENVMRAYVLESDISNSQSRINRYRTAAEIG